MKKFVSFYLALAANVACALEYPGHIMVATGTCANGNSWHWQCSALWKPSSEVVEVDLVAICTVGTPTSCSDSTKRIWRTASMLTETTLVRSCAVTPSPLTSKSGCPAASTSYAVAGEYEPPPEEPPPPPPSGILFTNVTSTVVDVAPKINTNFWAGLPDVNGDRCLDAFVGTHSDNSASGSGLWVQIKDETGCTGEFEYFAPGELNYTQPAATPRISSRYLWGNWYGHPQGLWSYFGHDIDGSPSARYPVLGLNAEGAPVFGAKSIGCPVANMFCLPLSLSIDGSLQLATRVRNYTTPGVGVLRNISTGSVLLSPNTVLPYANAHVVMDVNADGLQEIVVPALRGYLQLIAGGLVWQPNKITGVLPDPLAAGNHMTPIDYDSDGDMDLYAGHGTYSCTGCDNVQHGLKGAETFYPYMYQNNGDGTFTDVTASTGLVGVLRNKYYHTTYANTVVADLNLDGYPDLVFGAECQGHSATGVCSWVTLIMNDGDGTFSANRENNLGAFTSPDNQAGRGWINAGDFSNDGKIDIVKTHGISSPSHNSLGLFRNDSDVADHRWLRIRVAGAGVNTDGLGATIIARDPATDDVITSYQIGAFTTGYQNLATHAGVAYFTLVDVDVVLPNGLGTCSFDDVPTNAGYFISNVCAMTGE